jgi:hypothetical protein
MGPRVIPRIETGGPTESEAARIFEEDQSKSWTSDER